MVVPRRRVVTNPASRRTRRCSETVGWLTANASPRSQAQISGSSASRCCVAVLFWTNGWGYGVGAFFLSANMRTFWAAFTPLVAGMAGAAELEKGFGRLRGARYVGIVSGQGLSGVFFVAGLHTGLRLLVLANGLSFVVALALVLAAARVRRAPAVSTEDEQQQPRRGYRPVLADRVNVALAGVNVLATLLM